MKKFNPKILLVAGLLCFVSYSCKDITDVNVDPNNPVEVPASLLNAQIQYKLNNTITSRLLNGQWGMLMVQYWMEIYLPVHSRYAVNGHSFNLPFTDIYTNVLNEIKLAKAIVLADEGLGAGMKANQIASLDVMEVYAYHTLTDLFGAIPYAQALQPLDFSSPAYDSQEQVYQGIISTLQQAINSIDTNSPGFITGDQIYAGNMEHWKRFANSLLLRIAMRMSNVDEATARSVISGISGGFIEHNDQNAIYIFDANAEVANPLYIDAVLYGRDDFVVTDELITKLEDLEDPRLPAYAAFNISGEYVGMPYGEAPDFPPAISRPNPAVRAIDAPSVLMDAAETHFLLAEAYQRGILSGSAADAYDRGVAASMEFWGITDASVIGNYLDTNAYDAANWDQSIGVQKWLAFYMNGVQAWAEWRRLDYPQLVAPHSAVIDVIPVRLPYPIDEQTRNAAALSAVTSDPDDLSTKMWWDVY